MIPHKSTIFSIIIFQFVCITLGNQFTAQRIFKNEAGRFGLNDAEGNGLIAPKFDWAEELSEAMPLGIHFRYTEAEKNPAKRFVKVSLNSKNGLIDMTGKEILPLSCDYISKEKSSDNLLWFRPEPGKWSFIDLNTNTITATKYKSVETFHEGFSAVYLNQKVGFIDHTGKEVISLKYDYSQGFSEGIALVNLKNKYGYIDKSGKEITGLIFDYAKPFSEGSALVNLGGKWVEDIDFAGGKWGLIDKEGKKIVGIKYDKIGAVLNEHTIAVNVGAKWDQSCPCTRGGKWGIVNLETGKESKFLYDQIFPEKEGLLKVSLNGKYGFIDATGKEIIPVVYDNAQDFSDGRSKVNLNGKSLNINNQGVEIE